MSRFFLPLLLLLFQFLIHSANSSCPIDFNYVETFPWDDSLCREPVQTGCCQTLRSVLGMGLAQHLKQTSMFYLPNENSSYSCIVNFHEKLSNTSITVPLSFFASCFNDTTEFVNRPSSCAGIKTTRDWVEKVGSSSALDSSCNEDLTGLTRCSLCLDAGMKVTSYLVSLHQNSTKCFYFTIFYVAAIVNDFGPEDPRTAACVLGLPLATSFTDKKSSPSPKTSLKLAFGLVGAVVGVLIGVLVFVVYKKCCRKKKLNAMHEDYVSSVKSRISPKTFAKWFHITELEQATNGFSERNVIGRGGHGIVYKGTLSDGTQVAIKYILDLDTKGDDEFTNEAHMISKISHRNLLSLRGFCVVSSRFQGKRRYLVYDFMSNGSLDILLFSRSTSRLTWPQRKNIILDVAKGLAYLHNGIKPAIYHRDIKATNILLDDNMKARVADFGLAKQSTENQSHITTRVAGTYGYLAPEYALYGQLTDKSDVYSFGILILETTSGRRVLDATKSSRLLITDWAWDLVTKGKMDEILDESIRREGPTEVMARFVRVGILCAHVMVALRPTIADALKMLEGDVDIPRLPHRPLLLSNESYSTTTSSLRYSVFNSSTLGAKSSISG